MPAEKYAHASGENYDNPFDLPNLGLMGVNVVSGYGTGVILRTGQYTFFGQLADEIAGRHVPTAFDQGINRFTWLMIRFIFPADEVVVSRAQLDARLQLVEALLQHGVPPWRFDRVIINSLDRRHGPGLSSVASRSQATGTPG
jgi:magnesium-transporting ATPase (P-type)